MATFYLDFEGGNDANNGTTFALRWKTLTSGATAARCPAGSVVRVMGSPAPTSVGGASWNGATQTGNKGFASSTNATPIVVTVTAHGFVTGDTVMITGHNTNTKANGTWEVINLTTNTFSLTGSVGNGVGAATGTVRKVTNQVVMLATANTLAIAVTGNRGVNGNWTASTNVTCTVITTDYKEGGECQQITVATAFTTGKAAYFPTGMLNLSGYQQVSFWIKQTSGTVATTSDIKLALCSDTIGATIVNNIAIPALAALNQWNCVTVDLAGALGSSIQSIAFYVNVDRAAQTFLIDNIIACKASSSDDSLNLASLIGKNTTDDGWWAIQSINGTRVMLSAQGTAIPAFSTNNVGYAGVTESVTTYKRETIKLARAATTTTTFNTVQATGTAASPILYDGGWDRTAMTTKNLKTFLDGGNSIGLAIAVVSRVAVNFSSFGFVRLTNGLAPSGTGLSTATIDDIDCVGCVGLSFGALCTNIHFTSSFVFTTIGWTLNAIGCDIATVVVKSAISTYGFNYNGGSLSIASLTTDNCSVATIFSGNNISVASMVLKNYMAALPSSSLNISGGTEMDIGYLEITNNATSPAMVMSNGGVVRVRSGFTSGNLNGLNITDAVVFLRNFTIGEATPYVMTGLYSKGAVYSENDNAVAGAHLITTAYGTISSGTTTRHTASGISWKFQPTSANLNVDYPLTIPIAEVAVAANSLVTITAWVYRTNLGLTVGIMCKANQLLGYTADLSAAGTGVINTWEQVTITFTPTEAGVVKVLGVAYGGTTYSGYIDDLGVSQA